MARRRIDLVEWTRRLCRSQDYTISPAQVATMIESVEQTMRDNAIDESPALWVFKFDRAHLRTTSYSAITRAARVFVHAAKRSGALVLSGDARGIERQRGEARRALHAFGAALAHMLIGSGALADFRQHAAAAACGRACN